MDRRGQFVPLGVTQALVAAALFGLASPLAKCVLNGPSPLVVAGLLYLGSGIGLGRGRSPP